MSNNTSAVLLIACRLRKWIIRTLTPIETALVINAVVIRDHRWLA
jgi:hypothetical protein